MFKALEEHRCLIAYCLETEQSCKLNTIDTEPILYSTAYCFSVSFYSEYITGALGTVYMVRKQYLFKIIKIQTLACYLTDDILKPFSLFSTQKQMFF